MAIPFEIAELYVAAIEYELDETQFCFALKESWLPALVVDDGPELALQIRNSWDSDSIVSNPEWARYVVGWTWYEEGLKGAKAAEKRLRKSQGKAFVEEMIACAVNASEHCFYVQDFGFVKFASDILMKGGISLFEQVDREAYVHPMLDKYESADKFRNALKRWEAGIRGEWECEQEIGKEGWPQKSKTVRYEIINGVAAIILSRYQQQKSGLSGDDIVLKLFDLFELEVLKYSVSHAVAQLRIWGWNIPKKSQTLQSYPNTIAPAVDELISTHIN